MHGCLPGCGQSRGAHLQAIRRGRATGCSEQARAACCSEQEGDGEAHQGQPCQAGGGKNRDGLNHRQHQHGQNLEQFLRPAIIPAYCRCNASQRRRPAGRCLAHDSDRRGPAADPSPAVAMDRSGRALRSVPEEQQRAASRVLEEQVVFVDAPAPHLSQGLAVAPFKGHHLR